MINNFSSIVECFLIIYGFYYDKLMILGIFISLHISFLSQFEENYL